MELPQGLQLEKSETPVWSEEADDVLFAQGINVGRAHVIANLATRQNVKGENSDGIFGLRHEISV
jgi:hypothetical protein